MKLFHYQLQNVHGGIRFYLSLHSLIPPQHFCFIEYGLHNKRKNEKKKKRLAFFWKKRNQGGEAEGQEKQILCFFFRFLLNISYEITVSSDLIVVLTNLKREDCSRNHLNENLFERA